MFDKPTGNIMKKNLKKLCTALIIFLIIASSVIIYIIIQNNTADRIFSEAVIDIPENASNADEAVHLIEKSLITNMPYCRITRLYEDDTAFKPLIQRYNDDGKETLLLKMDFYVTDDAGPGPHDPGVLNTEYSWLFVRDNENSSWSLESHGYNL